MINQSRTFEVPAHVRDLANRNVEQARAGFSQLMDGMAQATGLWLNALPANPMTAGFKAINERSAQIAKQNVDACLAYASDLAGAKDAKEAFEIQGRFVQTQMHAYTTQVQEIGKTIASTAQTSTPKL